MEKYTCSVCGYVFDEEKGLPQAGVKPGTKWEDISEDFICPVCSAPKSAFALQGEKTPAPKAEIRSKQISSRVKEKTDELSNSELSIVFSNLSKGCEKQYKYEEQELFQKLSDYFKSISNVKKGTLEEALHLIETNLDSDFSQAIEIVTDEKDRGALRALVWSEKVTNIIKFLIERYNKEGSGFLETTKISVCEICGFIYTGNNVPDICPVCKVPKEKIHEVL